MAQKRYFGAKAAFGKRNFGATAAYGLEVGAKAAFLRKSGISVQKQHLDLSLAQKRRFDFKFAQKRHFGAKAAF
jgi:hypothetical protein